MIVGEFSGKSKRKKSTKHQVDNSHSYIIKTIAMKLFIVTSITKRCYYLQICFIEKQHRHGDVLLIV